MTFNKSFCLISNTILILTLAISQFDAKAVHLRNYSIPNLPYRVPKQDQHGELLLLQLIFRHGDRTPISLYANDPYNSFSWPEGLGMLTNRGKERLFKYGKVLRKRYQKYLDNIYIQNVISQSSPIRRCLETSEAVLAGIFPPKRTQIWSKSRTWPERILAKLWQPIGTETVEIGRSWKLNPNAKCPRAKQIDQQLAKSDPELLDLLANNTEFIKKVANKTGESFRKWQEIGWIYHIIDVEQEYFGPKFAMPSWPAEIGPDTLQKLLQFLQLQDRIYGRAPEFLKLRTGKFFNEVIDNFRKTANRTLTRENKTLYTYSSHDTMISYIMHALGYHNVGQPTYGSGLIMELRSNPSNRNSIPNVHLYYANVTNSNDIYPLKLNESEQFSSLCKNVYCDLNSFAESLKDFVEVDVEKDCKV